MIDFLRPGLLPSENQFDREYVKPIHLGLMNDSTLSQKEASAEKTSQLIKILDPFVQRKDARELAAVLPPMQQVVLHVRQSRRQSDLYRDFKRWQKKNSRNFFLALAALNPIHNHPGSLLFRKARDRHERQQERIAEGDEEIDDRLCRRWWDSVAKKYSAEKLSEHGFKIVLVLHILVLSTLKNEKVVIFSQCLKTLDFLEDVLGRDWLEWCPSLYSLLGDNSTFKGWKKDREVCRIDGMTKACKRGTIVDDFDSKDNVRVFLMSRASSVGINLVSLLKHFCDSRDHSLTPSVTVCRQSHCTFRYPLQSSGFGASNLPTVSIWTEEGRFRLPPFIPVLYGGEGLLSECNENWVSS